jgi:Family of unknown function (DUF5681)
MAKDIIPVKKTVTTDETPTIKGRFRKGQSGNPSGRRAGSRGKATLAALLLLDDECERLTRVAINLALGGDLLALRMCLDRLIPIRKDHPIGVALPKIATLQDLPGFTASLLGAVSDGLIGCSEAEKLSKIASIHKEVMVAVGFEQRLIDLETAANIRRNPK